MGGFVFREKELIAIPRSWRTPRIPERRRIADDRFSGEQISAEVEWGLHALVPGGGFSTYQLVFGNNQVDLAGCGDKDEDLISPKETCV